MKWEGEETVRTASFDGGSLKNLEIFPEFHDTGRDLCHSEKSSALRPRLIREVQWWSF